MITRFNNAELALIMGHLHPSGGWFIRDSEIVSLPIGVTDPTPEEMAAALAAVNAEAASTVVKAQKKTALGAALKDRLTDLGIEVKDISRLSADIEGLPAAAKTRRTGKTTTAARVAELEAQVDLLMTLFVILARRL